MARSISPLDIRDMAEPYIASTKGRAPFVREIRHCYSISREDADSTHDDDDDSACSLPRTISSVRGGKLGLAKFSVRGRRACNY